MAKIIWIRPDFSKGTSPLIPFDLTRKDIDTAGLIRDVSGNDTRTAEFITVNTGNREFGRKHRCSAEHHQGCEDKPQFDLPKAEGERTPRKRAATHTPHPSGNEGERTAPAIITNERSFTTALVHINKLTNTTDPTVCGNLQRPCTV